MSGTNPVPAPRGRSKISAVILAAGMSQRMGRPKQLLHLGERTLLEHALAGARGADLGEIVLVLGFAAEEIQKRIETNGIVVAINPDFQRGMGSSLRAGLSRIDPGAAGMLVILADQPFVQSSTLNCLMEYHRTHHPEIVIPTYKGFRGNPVLLDRAVFPEIGSLQGDVGCRAIFGGHTGGIHKLPLDDAGILLDVDTLEDFNKIGTLFHNRKAAEALPALTPKRELEIRTAEKTPSRPELVIVGQDALTNALARLGRILHFTTTLVDPMLTLEDLPEADQVLHRLDFSLLGDNRDRHIVVASRGQFDEEALEQALISNSHYVALVANKKRCEELVGTLKQKGFSQEALNRLHAPAGLRIGAEKPEEIALSIMAEIVAERAGSGP